jgi:hypothetical protein
MADVDLYDERAEELNMLESGYPEEMTRHVDNPYAATLELLVKRTPLLP